MDLIKTLLLYMTVSMASAIQEGPLPETVPTPTAVPQAIVETVEETPSLAVGIETLTPPPTATPTPRLEPTITPNKAYDNLQMNSRGNEVKKLQNRLIELGYLPEGSADGAYGYQTRRAVIAFQQANGLSADGVAGDATQTHLYQNPDVVPAYTPAPTQMPAPTAKPTAAPTDAPEAPVVSATIAPPVTDVATAAPEEANALGLRKVENASIVLSGSGSRLSGLRQEDGTYHVFYPQVWLDQAGKVVVSLPEFAACMGWTLTEEAGSVSLQASGYEIRLSRTSPVVCLVDKLGFPLADGAALAGTDTIYLSETFFRDVFHAAALWDADEAALILDIPDKAAAQSRD